MLPTFLIVGAMRSGTTSLARSIGAHPDVFMVPTKELHFFDSHFDRGIDWYESHFADAGAAGAIGEATPRYMYLEPAAARMASVVPEAKLVVILRDPVDRAYSHYWMNRARAFETLSFADALAAEADRGPGRYAYVGRGRYLEQLQRLCRHYPREQLLVLFLDELRARPQETFSAAVTFIGVGDAPLPAIVSSSVNRYYDLRSARLRRFGEHLPRRLDNLVGRFNRIDRGYPPMDEAVRADLARRFADDDAALAAWLGRDLPWST
jgi:hypothetical protein